MPRIEIELTSSRPDGTWTWRAAGARQPKGLLDGSVLPGGAKVGDVLRAEADIDIDGITVRSTQPVSQKKVAPERIEIVGSGRDEPPVTTNIRGGVEAGGERGRRGDRDHDRGRDRDRPGRGPGGPGRPGGPGGAGGPSRPGSLRSDQSRRPDGPGGPRSTDRGDRSARGPRPGGPGFGDRPGGDRAGGDRPGSDRAGGDRPGSDRAGGDRAGGDRPGSDRAGGDRAGGDRAGGDRAGGDRAGGDRAGGDRAGGDRAGGDRAGGDRAGGDRAGGDRAGGDRAGGDRAGGDRAGERPTGDRAGGEGPGRERRGGEGPGGERRDRPASDRSGRDRPSRPAGDRPTSGRPAGTRQSGERQSGDRPAGDRSRGERTHGERPARGAPRLAEPVRPKARRLQPGRVYRDAVLAELSPERKALAEQILRGGIPAVRQAMEEQNAQAREVGGPEIKADALLAVAEELVPALRAAEWRDRAEAAIGIVDEISVRDLRAVVSGADTARDEEGRALAAQLREALDRRSASERQSWVDEITASLDDGRVVRALRISGRPPEPGVRFPADLAKRLSDAGGEALTPDATPDRWAAVLEAVVASPVRRTITPKGLPSEPGEALTSALRQAAPRVPAIAALLGDPPDAPPRRPPRPPGPRAVSDPTRPPGRPAIPPPGRGPAPPPPGPHAAGSVAVSTDPGLPTTDDPAPDTDLPKSAADGSAFGAELLTPAANSDPGEASPEADEPAPGPDVTLEAGPAAAGIDPALSGQDGAAVDPFHVSVSAAADGPPRELTPDPSHAIADDSVEASPDRGFSRTESDALVDGSASDTSLD